MPVDLFKIKEAGVPLIVPYEYGEGRAIPAKLVEELNFIVGPTEVEVEFDLNDAGPIEVYPANSRYSPDGSRFGAASIELVPVEGCCGMVIATALNVSGPKRMGLGTWMVKLAEFAAASAGYTVVMATDLLSNVPTQRIFQKLRYRRVSTFVNRRTNNPLGVYMKMIKTAAEWGPAAVWTEPPDEDEDEFI